MLEPNTQRRVLETGMSSAGDVKGICKRAEKNLLTAVGPAAGCWWIERCHIHIHPLGWSEAALCEQTCLHVPAPVLLTLLGGGL